MSQFFAIHPDNPEARLLRKAAVILRDGGLIVYPTDSGYALACQTSNEEALVRIFSLRELEKDHYMTLVCRDLSLLETYAHLPSPMMLRLLNALTPGAYTFILKAKEEISRLIPNSNRKTIGFRVPANRIALSLLEHYEEPIISTSLILPGAEAPLSIPEAIHDLLGKQVDLIIDGGVSSHEPTTIVDLTGELPVILREGKGDPSPFELK